MIREIENYSQLNKILGDLDWQTFEKIVGRIFEFHEFDVKFGKVVTFEDTKRQYDVIAEKEYIVFIDCKNWDNKRRIRYGLKKAVEDQIERVEKIANDRKEKYPMIVTSNDNPIEFYKRVPIVPIQKLSEFLINFQIHKRKLLKIQ